MSDSNSAAQQRPPSPVELLESALTALVNAPGAFAKLAARPAPGNGACLILALSWGCLFFALNLIYFAPLNPAVFAALSAGQIAGAGLFGLALWTAFYLLASSCLYGLGRALGSQGDFGRALLLAAFVFAAAPVAGMCHWLDAAWFVPVVLAAWIAAAGLSALFKANPWAARAACAALAAAGLVVQHEARELLSQSAPAARSAAQLSEGLRSMQLKMEQVQTADASGAPPQSSGLDLLSAPSEDSPAPDAADQQARLERAVAAGNDMSKSVVAMLDSLAPMLDNPAISRNLNPRQRADFAELQKMIVELKSAIASGAPVTEEQQRKDMLKIQRLTTRMMGAGLGLPQPPGDKK